MKIMIDFTCPRCHWTSSATGVSREDIAQIQMTHVCVDGIRPQIAEEISVRLIPGPGERKQIETASVHWQGKVPTTCNLCHQPFGAGTRLIFVDGKVAATGQWAIMCSDCNAEFGVGLGIGKGQQYWFDTLQKVT